MAALVAVLLVGAPRAAAGADVSFLTWREFPYGRESWTLDAADLNRDGLDDLLVMDGATLVTLMADGKGGFGRPRVGREGSATGQKVVGADLNGDGRADAAVLYADGGLWVYQGDGAGELSSGQGFATNAASMPVTMVPLDFDRDGDIDFAVVLAGGSITGRVQLMANDGAGAFTPVGPAVPIGRAPGGATSGDFDGDGNPDVAVTNNLDRAATVVFGDGAGGLSGPVTFSTVPGPGFRPEPWGIAAGDFDRDGVDDLLVANGIFDLFGVGAAAAPAGLSTHWLEGPGFRFGNAALFLGSRTRRFSSPAFLPVDNYAVDVRVADINGDGRLDIAASGTGILTLTSRPDGGYDREDSPGAAGGPLALGHFNADALIDFATASLPPRVDVYFSRPGERFPGPFFLHTQRNPELGAQQFAATEVAAVDVNNDGIIDLVTPTGAANTLVTFLGTGDGCFGPPLTSPAGTTAFRLAPGDFNSDGCIDFVVQLAEVGGRSPLKLFAGDCSGIFRAANRVADDVGYSRIVVGDFDEDGKLDLAAVGVRFDPEHPSRNFSGAQVLLGDGAGHFRVSASLDTGETTLEAFVADLDTDGHSDLLLRHNCNFTAYLGRGDGSFGPARTVPGAVQHCIEGAALADFDEDGVPDLAVSQAAGPPTHDPTGNFWLRGDGRGGFVDPVRLTSELAAVEVESSYVGSMLAGDFTGDGHADIAVSAWHGITIYQGDGRGTFQPASPYFGILTGYDLTAADFNGDGRMDITGPGWGIDPDGQHMNVTLTLLFNDTPPDRVVAGDADCDGRVTASDLSATVRRLFSPLYLPACKGADANGDGLVTAADLVAIDQSPSS